jgi:hypothetical protein
VTVDLEFAKTFFSMAKIYSIIQQTYLPKADLIHLSYLKFISANSNCHLNLVNPEQFISSIALITFS